MNELVSVQKIKAIDVFTVNGMDPLLKAISTEVNSFVPDVSTVTTRKEIASLANKVARSKTLLDAMGKELTSEWKAKAKGVDYSRKVMRTYLDNLKVEIRLPLTEWENIEQLRIERIKKSINKIESLGFPDGELITDALRLKVIELNEMNIDDSWCEFQEQAEMQRGESLSHLEHLIEQRTQYEAEQTELASLRKEKVERDESDRLQKIEDDQKAEVERIAKEKAEAVEQAKRFAEEKARLEAEKAEQVHLDAIREKEQAEERAAQAERDAVLEKEKAELEKIEAVKRFKKREEIAIQKERERIEDENNKLIAEQKKREANMEHARIIHTEITDFMVLELKLTRKQSQDVIIAIASKKIPHMTIQY